MIHGPYSVKFNYSLHNSPPLIPVQSQMNLVHNLPPYFFQIYFNINFHLHLVLANYLFSSGFPIKTLKSFLLSAIRATCPPHFTFFDFILLITFGEEYKSEAPICGVLFSALLFRSSQVQIHYQSTLFLNARWTYLTLLIDWFFPLVSRVLQTRNLYKLVIFATIYFASF